jgi:hypothetical protein
MIVYDKVLVLCEQDSRLDIIKYITDDKYALSVDGTAVKLKADKLIYYILSSGSVRGSFARNTIIAAQSTTAQPHIPDNEGLRLYNHFDATFVSNDDHASSLSIAQKKFHSLQQKNNEKASDYIARVDLVVSNLAKLGENVSHNTWIFNLVNGLRAEYKETRNGVNFAKPGFQTVLEVKKSILNEESVSNNEPGKVKQTSGDKTDTAFVAKDHKDKTCHYCNKQGHIAPDCRRKLKDKANGVDVSKPLKGKGGKQKPSKGSKGKGKGKLQQVKQQGSYWCDNCQVTTHSTDYCRNPPSQDTASAKGGKGKPSAQKGKSYGRDQGWSNGNFPSDYSGSYANMAPDTHSDISSSHASWQSPTQWTSDNGDFGFMLQDNNAPNNSPAVADSSTVDSAPFVPRYNYEHVQHPLVGTPAYPYLFQIFIHWEPLYAPFPVTVRADMTIHDLMVPLSALLGIFLFLFFDYRMLHLRRRLNELPLIGPGATLILKRWWTLQKALAWSNEWRSLSTAQTKTMYWNFATSAFQRAHPCPSRQQLPSPVVAADDFAHCDVAFTIHDSIDSAPDESVPDNSVPDASSSMIPPTFPTWIPGRGQLWNVHYAPTMAFLLAYPTPEPCNIKRWFIHKYTDRL